MNLLISACYRNLSTSNTLYNENAKSFKKGFEQNIVLVDGVRTPFLQSFTDYSKLMPHELARYSLM